MSESVTAKSVPQGGLREQKKAKARTQMHLAALELVAAHGFNQVTADQIAVKAGVSPRTLFNYWLNKEAVVLGIDPNESEALVESLRQRPEGEAPSETIRAMLREKAQRSASIDSRTRKLRQSVLRKEPHLSHISMSENFKVQQTLIEVWTQKLLAQHCPEEAENLAIAHVSNTTALFRAAQTIAVKRDIDLGEALEQLFSYADAGTLSL